MTLPPKLFDHSILKLRRNRTDENSWFIHDKAIEEINDRLSEINRDFEKKAIIGFRAESWAKKLNLNATYINDVDLINFDGKSYDLIIHAMGLHRANDPVGQLIQMNRALIPDGLVISVFFGGQTLSELRISFAYAETKILNGISPRIAPMGEIRDLGGLLQRAGLALPVADNIKFDVSYETPLQLMHDLRGMAETNIIIDRSRKTMTKKLLNEISKQYFDHFSDNNGRVNSTFELIFLTGWAPAANQQKPLMPGSAKISLAQALNTTEKNPEKD